MLVPGAPQSRAGMGWVSLCPPHTARPLQVLGTAPTSGAHPFVQLSPLSPFPAASLTAHPTAETPCPHSGPRTPALGGGSLHKPEEEAKAQRSGPDPGFITVSAYDTGRQVWGMVPAIGQRQAVQLGLALGMGSLGQPPSLPRDEGTPGRSCRLHFSVSSCCPPFLGCPTPATPPPWSTQAI